MYLRGSGARMLAARWRSVVPNRSGLGRHNLLKISDSGGLDLEAWRLDAGRIGMDWRRWRRWRHSGERGLEEILKRSSFSSSANKSAVLNKAMRGENSGLGPCEWAKVVPIVSLNAYLQCFPGGGGLCPLRVPWFHTIPSTHRLMLDQNWASHSEAHLFETCVVAFHALVHARTQ